MEALQLFVHGEALMAFLTLFALALVCCGLRWGQINRAATLTLVMAVLVSVSSLIVALSEESTPDLQPAMSFGLVLVIYAILFKGVHGLIFVAYVQGASRNPTNNLGQGHTGRESSSPE
ncbi:MAG: hypothetical protein AAF525_18725 [Pseudomonadota bacterium]